MADITATGVAISSAHAADAYHDSNATKVDSRMLHKPGLIRWHKLYWKSFIFLVPALLLWATVTTAQQQGWLRPSNVSDSPAASQAPVVAVDYDGNAHVIWAEHASSDPGQDLDTAFYAVQSDGAWSVPMDVMAVSAGDSLYPRALKVDPFGRLVLVATHNSGLSVNFAEIGNAGSAQGWTSVRLNTESTINSADLAIDTMGTYHLVYVLNNREVVYTDSSDGGMTWSAPQTLVNVEDEARAVIGPAIAASDDHGIYVTWTETAEENNWSPVGVWFARSLDSGTHWDPPMPLASGAGNGSSAVLATDPATVHVYWNGSAGTRGRYHRYSRDRGKTWSETIVAMPTTIGGFAGRPHLLLDSSNTLHVLVAGLGNGRETIWHSTWRDTSWSEPVPISGTLPNSQGVSAAIGQGHVITAVWNELERGDVWNSRLDTGSPAVISQVLPTSTPVPKETQVTTSTSASVVTVDSTATPDRILTQSQDSPTNTITDNPTFVVLVSVLPAVLLMSIVVVVYARQRR